MEVSSTGGDVGLFELCNPHLLATDLLQVISSGYFLWQLLVLTSNQIPSSAETSPPLASAPNRKGRSSSPGQVSPITQVFTLLILTSPHPWLIQASEEEKKERRKWEEWWKQNCDWRKCRSAEVSWGEAEGEAKSQIWRHSCKRGRRKQLKATKNYLAIMVLLMFNYSILPLWLLCEITILIYSW